MCPQIYGDAQAGGEHLSIKLLSQENLGGVAGNFVTVQAEITNNSPNPVSDVTTYLSLVDMSNKLPVDLEDWSAEKGLFIGSIAGGQTLPLTWKIHFVKAGDYYLSIIAVVAGNNQPYISRVTIFTVAPKINLNPGEVLPVALATPIIVLIIMGLLQYLRRRRFSA
jgi:hypothetical protein